mgnify:CR=1 FL=1
MAAMSERSPGNPQSSDLGEPTAWVEGDRLTTPDGEFTLEAVLLFAAGTPLMLLGMFLGDRIQTRLREDHFRRIVCLVLIVSGLPLIFR